MATGRLPKGAGLRPKARSERLIVQELPDELLIYDLDRHEAFCLNRTASLVWRNCNGRRSVSQLASIVETQAPSPADETLVWLALDRLEMKTGSYYNYYYQHYYQHHQRRASPRRRNVRPRR